VVGAYSTMGFDIATSNVQNCININQSLLDQIVSQSIIKNALDLVFANDLSSDMKLFMTTGQFKVNEGFSFPDLGPIIIIIIVIIVAAVVLRNKPNGPGGQPQQIAPAWAGILLVTLGIIAVIVGIILGAATDLGWILGGLTIIAGLLMAIVGAVIWVRAVQQQKKFRQQLLLAQVQSGQVRGPNVGTAQQYVPNAMAQQYLGVAGAQVAGFGAPPPQQGFSGAPGAPPPQQYGFGPGGPPPGGSMPWETQAQLAQYAAKGPSGVAQFIMQNPAAAQQLAQQYGPQLGLGPTFASPTAYAQGAYNAQGPPTQFGMMPPQQGGFYTAGSQQMYTAPDGQPFFNQ